MSLPFGFMSWFLFFTFLPRLAVGVGRVLGSRIVLYHSLCLQLGRVLCLVLMPASLLLKKKITVLGLSCSMWDLVP